MTYQLCLNLRILNTIQNNRYLQWMRGNQLIALKTDWKEWWLSIWAAFLARVPEEQEMHKENLAIEFIPTKCEKEIGEGMKL